MSTRSILFEGEEEAPTFAELVKQFKRKLGKSQFERWVKNFGKDKSLEDLFTSLWNDEDAHCYMSPVLGNGEKSSEKSAKIHQVADSLYKIGEIDKAYDYFNLSLVLAPHPRVPLPFNWLYGISDEPDPEPDASNSLGGSKDPENISGGDQTDRASHSGAGGASGDSKEGPGNMGRKQESDDPIQKKSVESSAAASAHVSEPEEVAGSSVLEGEGKEGDKVLDPLCGQQETKEVMEEGKVEEKCPSVLVVEVSETEIEEFREKNPQEETGVEKKSEEKPIMGKKSEKTVMMEGNMEKKYQEKTGMEKKFQEETGLERKSEEQTVMEKKSQEKTGMEKKSREETVTSVVEVCEGEVKFHGKERSAGDVESLSSIRVKEVQHYKEIQSEDVQELKIQLTEVIKDSPMTPEKIVLKDCGNVSEQLTGATALDESLPESKEKKETCSFAESEMMSSPKLEKKLHRKSSSVEVEASTSVAESMSFEEEEAESEQAGVDESLDEVCDKLMRSFTNQEFSDAASLIGSSVCLYSDLVTGFEMRALLMFKYGEFERSINAIDMAIKYGSAGLFLKGIEALRLKCEEFIKKRGKQKNKNKLALFASGCQPPPVMKEFNPKMPALSASVIFRHTSPANKYLLTTTQDIKPGDILGIEEPYCSIVNRGELMNFCSNCLQRSCAPIPCPDCSIVVFCSEECSMKDWRHPHWPLCNVVLPSLVAMKMDSIVMLAAHVLTQTTFLKVKEMEAELKKEEALPLQFHGFNDGIYKSSDYRSVYHLVTNEEERTEEERFIISAEAFALTKLLRESNRYFIDETGKPFNPTYEDVKLTGTLIVRHLMNLKCSAVALSEFRVVISDYDKSWSSCFGCGVYPSISLAKHSCNPNAALYNHGKTVGMFATRSIPKNTPITLSYVTQFRLTATDVRKSILEKNYYFSCNCVACENDWFPDFDEIFQMKCLKCSKAIDLKTGSCPVCQLFYREGKEYKGSKKAPYNLFFMKDKLYQAASICKKAKLKILSKGDCFGKNRTNIIQAIELMEKYLKEPCSMLLDAQEALRISYLREGSWFQVKERTKGWIVGPAFLINSSLTGKEEVHSEFYDDASQEDTPRRKARRARHSQGRGTASSEIPPPHVPIFNKNEESVSSDLYLD